MAAPQRTVIVAGLKRQPIEYFQYEDGNQEKGIKQEDNLGMFFWNADLEVEAVTLEVFEDVSRGFGYVTFAKEEDAKKAVDSFNDKPAPELTGSDDGTLTVELAKVEVGKKLTKKQQLLKEMAENEALARNVRAIEARNREKELQIQLLKKRQSDLQKALDDEKEEEELRKTREEKERIEAQLKDASEKEEWNEIVLQVEQQRVNRLEENRARIDFAQIDHFDQVATKAAMIDIGKGEYKEHVKKTFIHVDVIPQASTLVRSRTAPAETSYSASPPEASEAVPIAPKFERTISWRQANDVMSPKATSDLPRRILSQRMDIEEDASKDPTFDREKAWEGVRKEVIADTETAENPEDSPHDQQELEKAASPVAASSSTKAFSPPISLGQAQRRVRLKKVPFFPQEQLKSVLLPELHRLWKVGRQKPPPPVEMGEIVLVDAEATKTIHPALLNFMEVIIQFKHAEDAAWMVEGRLTKTWFTGLNVSLKGVIVDVEWAEPRAHTDLRKLCYKAPSDQASVRSWQSKGTAQSNSTLIQSKVQGTLAAKGALAPVAERNCTVVLEGIPQDMATQQVRVEVLALLKRLWENDGMPFDESDKLRGGSEGGIVTFARNATSAASGSCVVKFRHPLDARWMVQDGSKRALRLGSRAGQLQVKWAKTSGF